MKPEISVHLLARLSQHIWECASQPDWICLSALSRTTYFHQHHHQPVPESLWNCLHTKPASLSNSTPARGISRWPPVLVFNSSCHEHSSWHHCSLSPWPWIPTGLLSTENEHSTIRWQNHSHYRPVVNHYWILLKRGCHGLVRRPMFWSVFLRLLSHSLQRFLTQSSTSHQKQFLSLAMVPIHS